MDTNEFTSFFNEMPDFNNHDEARSWLKEQFHEKCLFRGSDSVEGQTVYFYHLIKDPDVYQQYMESFASEHEQEHKITNMKTFESYHTIVVTADGEITIQS
ncbi:hypothetical protein GCM10008967_35310 [Bacillus carboniphilus]|uniref:Uncharacterized protein n=1 Tax=Bacillus carboniphilus TaxID=86663 RepID=A0ABN0WMF1_9BACI